MMMPEAASHLLAQLVRLTASISVGLLVACLVESLNWVRVVAKLAEPLVRLGRLRDISGASFSLALFSNVAANSMLAEALEAGELSKREIVLSNLLNSLPTYLIHLPSSFFLAYPVIGGAAGWYVLLLLLAAFLRTLAVIVYGRLFLPPLPEGCVVCRLEEAGAAGAREALARTWKRFKRRIRRVILYTLPIYALFFWLTRAGFFSWIEHLLAQRVELLSAVPAQALGVVVFSMAGESTGAMAAAGALLATGGLPFQQVILALLVGNLLASPVRVFKTQYPYYAGIFKPAFALNLVVLNQAARIASILAVAVCYWLLS